MKKILKKIEWVFDFYFAWMFYSPQKYYRYNKYIERKWGKNGRNSK